MNKLFLNRTSPYLHTSPHNTKIAVEQTHTLLLHVKVFRLHGNHLIDAVIYRRTRAPIVWDYSLSKRNSYSMKMTAIARMLIAQQSKPNLARMLTRHCNRFITVIHVERLHVTTICAKQNVLRKHRNIGTDKIYYWNYYHCNIMVVIFGLHCARLICRTGCILHPLWQNKTPPKIVCDMEGAFYFFGFFFRRFVCLYVGIDSKQIQRETVHESARHWFKNRRKFVWHSIYEQLGQNCMDISRIMPFFQAPFLIIIHFTFFVFAHKNEK